MLEDIHIVDRLDGFDVEITGLDGGKELESICCSVDVNNFFVVHISVDVVEEDDEVLLDDDVEAARPRRFSSCDRTALGVRIADFSRSTFNLLPAFAVMQRLVNT